MERGSYEEIDHTADLGLDLRGPDPAAVLEAARRGLLRVLMGEEPDGEPEEERRVELSEPTRPDLLKAWCEWIYRLLEEERFVALGSEFESTEPERFRARLEGVVLPADRVASASELKAVTYHQLSFEREEEGGGWRARVIFDV
ncbi:MAG: archease [Gemmatimonadota bacterium]|nr:archease [Gemmatimonadota bacterium]